MLTNDIRVALRQLRSNPGFALAAVLSLALGIGATTMIFSLGNGLLNKQIQAHEPDRLARVYLNAHSPLPYAALSHLQNTARGFSALAGERPLDVGLALDSGTEHTPAALVTPNYFATLGIGAAEGRVFSSELEREGASPPVVVLAHDYWRARFGGDPDVIGRALTINEQLFTVVGVAEEGFTSSQIMWRPRLFLPVGQIGPLTGTELAEWQGTLYVTGRLADGTDLRQAHAEIETLGGRLQLSEGERDSRMTLRVEHARGITAEARLPLSLGLTLLLGSAVLVLLIACANVANLLLARATERRREIAARLALGAPRRRIVQQLLTESLLLALIGGAVGYAIAHFATPLFPRLVPDVFALDFDPTPDRTVLLFTLAIGVLTAVTFGLIPALRASSCEVASVLKNQNTGPGLERSRLRDGLVVAQVAFCVLALAMAGLFVRSLGHAHNMDPGFAAAGVLDVPVYLEGARYDTEAGTRFYAEVVRALQGRPEVRSASASRFVPLSGSNSGGALIRRGIDEASPGQAPSTYKNEVAPGYFEMLDIDVVRGREFDDRDAAAAPGVVILNETAARRLWPGEDPLGQRVAIDDPAGRYLEVVGVVEDTKYNSLGEEAQTFAYLPLLQQYREQAVLHVRPTDSAGSATRAVGEVLESVDPRVAMGTVRPMTDDMSVSLIPTKAAAILFGVFGLMALVIAGIGVYGVTAYVVSRRTREIGVRRAIGAGRRDVLRLVLHGTLRRVSIGVLIGVALAIGAGQLLSGLLYGVSPFDPMSILVTPAILLAVGAIATYIPARRAATMDPVSALRYE